MPEDQRYWFLAPSGTSPHLEAEHEAKLRDHGLTEQDATDLKNIESDIRRASVFGRTEQEAAEIREETKARYERMEAVGYGIQALDVPWWPDVYSWEHAEGEGREYPIAPILYTKRELAEEEERRLRDHEPEGYLQLAENYGQATTDDALDNSLPYKALWVDRDTLLGKLEDSDFLCLMVVDGGSHAEAAA